MISIEKSSPSPLATKRTEPALAAEEIAIPAETTVALSTLQRNALAQFLQRRDFSPRDIAGFDYDQIANLPKIGRKGIVAIRAWLNHYGLDLRNPPQNENDRASRRQQAKLEQAINLLKKHGYRILPP